MKRAVHALSKLPLLAWLFCLLVGNAAPAATLTGQETAEVFFTTLANQFFRQQFNFGATNIPIAPTNEYSPAVHRLLQVAANIYDATRSDPFPSVFRPLFTSNAAGVMITGYTNDNRASTLAFWLVDNKQFGIPLIIGAKKGFPNFNEYTLRTDLQVTRKLEFVRPDTNSPPNQTNQMYILGISNLFAAEAWNSYLAPYTRALSMEVANVATIRITNGDGLDLTLPQVLSGIVTNLGSNTWQGRQFLLPLYQQEVLLPPSRFLFQSGTFEPVGTNYYFTETESDIGFPVPDWQFSISNQFLYVLTDTDSGNIVDFVLSTAFNSAMNLDTVLMNYHPLVGGNVAESPIVANLWDTNRADSSQNITIPTLGIVNQIDVGTENIQVDNTTWRNYVDPWARGMEKLKAITSFRAFLGQGVWGPYATNLAYANSNRMQAPFNPTRKIIQTTTWQTDDPLVHTFVADLLIFPTNSICEAVVPPTSPVPTNMTLASIGRLNNRYAPWAGNPEKNDPWNPSDVNAFNPAVKDPGVRYSDDWDFPSGQPLSVAWLGRVHRGTPWQTIYLKPDVASVDTWRIQSADYLYSPPGPNHWTRTHPTNDWAMMRLMVSLLNTNPPDRLVSINDSRPSAWASVWDGLTVLSNNLSDQALLGVAKLTNWTIPFATLLMSSNSPQAATLNDALNRARAVRPGNRFRDLADFLTVPELSVFSPWLNTAPNVPSGKYVQRMFGLTDTAYEAIPSQILARLREEDVWGASTRTNTNVQVQFAVWPGYACDVEVSSNLTQWTSLQGGFTVSNQLITVDAPVTPDTGPRFFRAKLSPASP